MTVAPAAVARARMLLPQDTSESISRRLAYAHDASHYLFTPAAVVTARSTEDIARLLAGGAGPLTFRSGGTSLSGQAGTDQVLVDTRQHFRSVTVLDEGMRVRVQPGATIRSVNAHLARYGRQLGPDPASEAACTVGGVIANNSSGMACGTAGNTYRTLLSAILVLPSGTVIDTSRSGADADLARSEPALYDGLVQLRDRIRSDPPSVRTIERLFSLKNTMGYGVNAFLDYDAPVDILTRIVIGSEGTLAFVAEATFATVPIHEHIATGFLVFSTLAAATAALPELVASGLATIELLDATSLQVAGRDPQAPAQLRDLEVIDHAGLLVEYQEPTAAALTQRREHFAEIVGRTPVIGSSELTDDLTQRGALWHVRKGLYAAIAGDRPVGTTALLEDIAVPVAQLRATCTGLHRIFDRYGYADAVIFGHAKDGNIHFMITADLADSDALARYGSFTEDMVELVLDHGGTLKAEHGTGRIMAPFVRRQYGSSLYQVMREVKKLIDPHTRLNPGVVLTDDPQSHLKALKTTPKVEAEVDRCVECGYCEPVCPSRDVTLTPRQRIVLRREMVQAQDRGQSELAAQLRADYEYDGVQTCAVDGMCQSACPVGINTGDLVRRLRAQEATTTAQTLWSTAARNWDGATRAGAWALNTAQRLPGAWSSSLAAAGRSIVGAEALPLWSTDTPSGGLRRKPQANPAADVVYFPSCLGTLFAAEGSGVSAAFARLCRQAGVGFRVPEGIESMCCGTPWSSKGMTHGYEHMRTMLRAQLWEATDEGRLPVVADAASCTEGLLGAIGPELTVVDAVSYTRTQLLDRLAAALQRAGDHGRILDRVIVHPTCSTTALGSTEDLVTVAGAAADVVTVPVSWGCCGFAGDRGMLHPELTTAATAAEVAEIAELTADAYISANRTCEMGMSQATGQPYQHVLEVLASVLT